MLKLFAALYYYQCLSVLRNYFDDLTKVFSDVAKFLDISVKLFFSYISNIYNIF